MSTLLETLVTFLTALTGLIAAAVALDQITATARRRRAVEFWHNRIQASEDEADEFAFTMLQREELSKLVATAWVHPEGKLLVHAYFWVTGVGVAAWLGYSLTSPERTNDLTADGMLWVNIAFAAISPSFLFKPYCELFVFYIQRSQIRRQFLRGEEPIAFQSIHGEAHTLQLLTGGVRATMGALLLSIATVGASFVVAFIAFGESDHEKVWIVFVALFTVFAGFWGLALVGRHLVGLSPETADLYPPHGDDGRSAKVHKRIEERSKPASSKGKSDGMRAAKTSNRSSSSSSPTAARAKDER